MRVSEWVALVYFAYLLGVGLARRPAPLSRTTVLLEVLAGLLVVPAVARWGASGDGFWPARVREWMPMAYLLWFYWVPARLAGPLDLATEHWLVGFDRRWANPLIRAVARGPRPVVEGLECAYLCCYPLLPAGCAVRLASAGPPAVDGYWTAVLVAGAVSYGVLPWIATRPPRQVEPALAGRDSLVRRLNEQLLSRASVQLNTLPSGHVATAVAAAIMVAVQEPAAGALFLLLSALIAVACVSRRYHFLIDVLLGVGVGMAASAVAMGLA